MLPQILTEDDDDGGAGELDEEVEFAEGLPMLINPTTHDFTSQSENVPPALFRKQIAEFDEIICC